jgi:Zn-dependent M32 family carboxypeptidase
MVDNDNLFNLEAFKKKIEEVKEQLEKQREASKKVDERVETDDRWAEQKEAFGKLLDAYDDFLPQADVAKIFGVAAGQLEQTAEKLKEMQKAAQEKADDEEKE